MLQPRTPNWAEFERKLVVKAATSGTLLAGLAPHTPNMTRGVNGAGQIGIGEMVSGAGVDTLLLEQQWGGVGQIRIRDMVSGGCGESVPEQKRRQLIVFDALIAPLVQLAEQQPLDRLTKQLLIEAVAATGFRGTPEDNRQHYRTRFDELLRCAMRTFAVELDLEMELLRNGSVAARCSFSGECLQSKMPLDRMPARLKRAYV
jgi:hypothetical protein